MAKDKRSIPTRTDIKWPKGKSIVKFRKSLEPIAETILNGRILAIDPASGGSSMPGYAWFDKGELQASGEIALAKKKPIQERLKDLLTVLETGFNNPPPDILVIEKIRGSRTHHYLFWSIGVTVAGSEAPTILELPIPCWKAVVPDDYEKTDEDDAKYIGQTLIILAKEILENG